MRVLHYSGKGPYTILHTASRTSDLKQVIVYRQEYASDRFPFHHVRDVEEFTGTVSTPQGEVPRFLALP